MARLNSENAFSIVWVVVQSLSFSSLPWLPCESFCSARRLVGRIAIGDDFFGVLCELCVQYRFDGFESAVRHGLKMNPSVAFGQPDHHGFGGFGHL
jgi:hypothetical protein